MRKFLSKLGYFKYTLHNIFAHPLSEIFHLLGFSKLSAKIHDETLPLDHDEE